MNPVIQAAKIGLVVLALSGVLVQAQENRAARATVRTQHEVKLGQGVSTTQWGSGTVVRIADDHFFVLTCAHVLEHAGQHATGVLRVVLPDGKSYPARPIKILPQYDLSLLRVEGKYPGLAARIALKEDFSPGTKLYKSGHPGACQHPVLLEGSVVGHATSVGRDDIRSIIASAPSRSGDSGGGLYRSSDHCLVGVVWGGRDGKLYATELKRVQEILRELASQEKKE